MPHSLSYFFKKGLITDNDDITVIKIYNDDSMKEDRRTGHKWFYDSLLNYINAYGTMVRISESEVLFYVAGE